MNNDISKLASDVIMPTGAQDLSQIYNTGLSGLTTSSSSPITGTAIATPAGLTPVSGPPAASNDVVISTPIAEDVVLPVQNQVQNPVEVEPVGDPPAATDVIDMSNPEPVNPTTSPNGPDVIEGENELTPVAGPPATDATKMPGEDSFEEKRLGPPISIPMAGPNTTLGSVSISVSVESIVVNQSNLKNAAAELENLWRTINAEIARINDSWVGQDASMYTDKLTKMEPRVRATIYALKAIANTYSRALQNIEDNQNRIKNELA